MTENIYSMTRQKGKSNCEEDVRLWGRTEMSKYKHLASSLFPVVVQAQRQRTCDRRMFTKKRLCWMIFVVSFLTAFIFICSPAQLSREQVHVAVAACGDRLGHVLVMAKSLALTATHQVFLHVLLEDKLQKQFENAVSAWPDVLRRKLHIDIRDVVMPTRTLPGIPLDFWPRHFNDCAYQTMFIPEALSGLDKVIFVDADTIFLSPVQDLWNQMASFDTNQCMGITLEQNPGGPSFYSNFKRHPIYRDIGLNTGMILYNLQKINRTQFLIDIKDAFVEYEKRRVLRDQFVLNIVLHFHPEKVFETSCAWNYRSDYCPKSTCKDAQENGIRLLHGNRGVWHNNNVPPFAATFVAFRDTPIHNISVENVLSKLKGELSKSGVRRGTCGDKHDIFTTQLERIAQGHR